MGNLLAIVVLKHDSDIEMMTLHSSFNGDYINMTYFGHLPTDMFDVKLLKNFSYPPFLMSIPIVCIKRSS